MMESRRRQRWDNRSRPHNTRPPRSTWQPSVPSWEKQFCKVVGTFDWNTLLQMKRFTHIYEDVINWDDSAGEEAFFNAKKRFWAQIHGYHCTIPLPDPDLYIDEINWEEEVDPELLTDLECTNVVSNMEEDHDPVIIFGEALLPNQTYPTQGWGDIEDNLNQTYQPDGWGDINNNFIQAQPNYSSANTWGQNWGDPYNNGAAIGWPVYTNNAWQYSDGSGQMAWGGGWYNDWEWNYANNNNFNHEAGVGPSGEDKKGDGGRGPWNYCEGSGENYIGFAPDYDSSGFDQMNS